MFGAVTMTPRTDGDLGGGAAVKANMTGNMGEDDPRSTVGGERPVATRDVIDLCDSSGDEGETAVTAITSTSSSTSTSGSTSNTSRHAEPSSTSSCEVIVLDDDDEDQLEEKACNRTQQQRTDPKKRSCREITDRAPSPRGKASAAAVSYADKTACRDVMASSQTATAAFAATAAKRTRPPLIVLGSDDDNSSGSSFHQPHSLRDPGKVTYGILPLLEECLLRNQRQQPPTEVSLSMMTTSSTLQHIQQSDKWSCGFRNLQMLLTALVPLLPPHHLYFQKLHHVYSQPLMMMSFLDGSSNNDSNKQQQQQQPSLLLVPSLTQLQEQLEESWRQGFDNRGARHFQYSIVGRPSRIGACEVCFACSFWHLDACVAQFLKCHASRRCLPLFCYAYFGIAATRRPTEALPRAEACMAWAEEQLATPQQPPQKLAKTTPLEGMRNAVEVLPLYLQWEGHSVTVIGVEPPSISSSWNWNQWNLLILDPLVAGDKLKQALQQPSSMAPLRLPCRSLANKDCQLMVCSSGEISHAQRSGRKENVPAVTAAKDLVMKMNGTSSPEINVLC